MLAGSKPSRSDGTHTIFLAAQSAWATPLLRKSFSRKRYLSSSVAGSAMLEDSPLAVGLSGMQGSASAAAIEPGDSEVAELTSGSLQATGSASGAVVGIGLTSDVGLTSGLLVSHAERFRRDKTSEFLHHQISCNTENQAHLAHEATSSGGLISSPVYRFKCWHDTGSCLTW